MNRRHPPGAAGWALIALAVIVTVLLLGAPLLVIFQQGLAKGWGAWWRVVSSRETAQAVGLTLLTMAVVVPLSGLYGLAAAWAVTKFRWAGKKWLVSLIELPYSISPIVAGVACLTLYGSSGAVGAWLLDHDIQIMFAAPGIILATLFVVSPFVARELMPLMHLQGCDDEEAALTLGAGGLRIFLAVTLPNVKWALLYGLILCAARALGEFGAVSVVSGHIRGQTNTLPLYIDLLYHDYDNSGAFAVASLLTLLALVALVLKLLVERRAHEGFLR